MPRFFGRFGFTAFLAISLISLTGCMKEKSAQLEVNAPSESLPNGREQDGFT